jgi:uncharacterized membrane protein HdeD (DUF308 family)
VALLAVGLGAILCIAGILRITMRPAANPLFGRRMIVLGLLLVAAAFWLALPQPAFRPDR